jgi:hypothetical protein
MSTNISVGGEVVTTAQAIKLVDRLYKRAADIAGAFYEGNRSPKFRMNWKSADDYAEANKNAFIAQARADFSRILADDKADPNEKRLSYLAILLERAFSEGLKQLGKESDTQLQILKGTQQFDGDSYENKKIIEKFGVQPNLRAKLKAGAAKFARDNSLH